MDGAIESDIVRRRPLRRRRRRRYSAVGCRRVNEPNAVKITGITLPRRARPAYVLAVDSSLYKRAGQTARCPYEGVTPPTPPRRCVLTPVKIRSAAPTRSGGEEACGHVVGKEAPARAGLLRSKLSNPQPRGVSVQLASGWSGWPASLRRITSHRAFAHAQESVRSTQNHR